MIPRPRNLSLPHLRHNFTNQELEMYGIGDRQDMALGWLQTRNLPNTQCEPLPVVLLARSLSPHIMSNMRVCRTLCCNLHSSRHSRQSPRLPLLPYSYPMLHASVVWGNTHMMSASCRCYYYYHYIPFVNLITSKRSNCAV